MSNRISHSPVMLKNTDSDRVLLPGDNLTLSGILYLVFSVGWLTPLESLPLEYSE